MVSTTLDETQYVLNEKQNKQCDIEGIGEAFLDTLLITKLLEGDNLDVIEFKIKELRIAVKVALSMLDLDDKLEEDDKILLNKIGYSSLFEAKETLIGRT